MLSAHQLIQPQRRHMNMPLAPERLALELVDIIDLKWLMARDGHHVHVERLQAEPAYARECLIKAAASQHAATFYGTDYKVTLSGLDREIAWAQVSNTEVFLYIPYGFVVGK